MDYEFLPPTLGCWRRDHFAYTGEPVLRVREYETLEKVPLSGRILDVGGGRNARYMSHVGTEAQIESVNIDPNIDPTHRIEPGAPFPLDDQSVDGAICLNTLEHVYDPAAVLDEILRVLKPGASATITVPFIFRIHGHPDDFTRATPSWWRETARRAGFSRMTLMPLTWGRYTTGGMITGYRGIWPRGQFHFAHLKDWLYARAVFAGQTTYAGRRGERICSVAPGWFITLTR